MNPDGFRDRRHRFSYLVARENARRVALEPAILDVARRHLESRLPEFASGAESWRALLDRGAEAVATALTCRGESGDYLRESSPSFGALPGRTRAKLLAQAASPIDGLDPTP